jgi:hypothetical protein
MRRLMLALGTAIERVETVSSQRDALPLLQSLNRLLEERDPDIWVDTPTSPPPVQVIDHATISASYDRRLRSFLTDAGQRQSHQTRKRIGAWAASVLIACMAAFFAVALYAALSRQFLLFGSQAQLAVKETPPAIPDTKAPAEAAVQSLPIAAQPQTPSLPLPTVYGVYAVSNGQLNELEALPGRAPDQRVLMSAAISRPSQMILRDGRIVFVVYRRDIASSAPDRVAVRVVAKVTRAMMFDAAGKPNTAPVDDTWTIRNISFEFRVAPVNENPEMLVLRPENSDFAFPAGRYALVLKGQAYDFTVAGSITDAAQCLERLEATNGSFYSECRNP